MLITCSSCNSKYLVNSADLKPQGRVVRCAKCGIEWHQSSDLTEEMNESKSSHVTNTNIKNENNAKYEVHNLPSTIVKDQKPSFINTVSLLLFFAVIIFGFWIMKNESENVMALTNFYIHEFYFNLKLIINDFAKIIYQILN